MRCLLMVLLGGCDFGASTKVEGVDTGGPSLPSSDGDTDADGGATDDTGGPDSPGPDPQDVDNDDDGYTENEGDCDDDDDGIRPGLTDVCDGEDNDCDDAIDEDASVEDTYEPNDSLDHDLGDLDAVGAFEIEAFLHDEDDVDRFRFLYTDSLLDLDGLEVTLTQLSAGITYKIKVIDVESEETLFEDFNTSETDDLSFTLDSSLGTDSGEFRVQISSLGGSGCTTPYKLHIVHSDWWGAPPEPVR